MLNKNLEKIRGSSLVPFRRDGNKVFVFMQKRSADAPRAPGYFGFFGGHTENSESPEETLKREIIEELNYEPRNFHLLGRYTVRPDLPEGAVLSVFVEKVGIDFESKVTINEGESGTFVNINELAKLKILEEHQVILKDLRDFLYTAHWL